MLSPRAVQNVLFYGLHGPGEYFVTDLNRISYMLIRRMCEYGRK